MIVIDLFCARCGRGSGAASAMQESSSVRDLSEDSRYSFIALASGLPHDTSFVIRDEKSWSDFWNELTRSGSPGAPLPEVDFSREQVLVAALGPVAAGHDIHITGVRANGDTLFADVTARAGIPLACRTDEINSPLSVVVVRRFVGSVVFRERRMDLGCR
jgi:hypothetical protein